MEQEAQRLKSKYSRKQIIQLINLLSPQAPTGTMTPQEFARLQDKLLRGRNSYSETSIAIARLHFVEGASAGEAAKECGVTYQCAYAVLCRIRKNFLTTPHPD